MSTNPGVRLESWSLGANVVHWRIVYPPFMKRRKGVAQEYPHKKDACEAMKKAFSRDEVEPRTAEVIEIACPEIEWGSGRTGSPVARS